MHLHVRGQHLLTIKNYLDGFEIGGLGLVLRQCNQPNLVLAVIGRLLQPQPVSRFQFLWLGAEQKRQRTVGDRLAL